MVQAVLEYLSLLKAGVNAVSSLFGSAWPLDAFG